MLPLPPPALAPELAHSWLGLLGLPLMGLSLPPPDVLDGLLAVPPPLLNSDARAACPSSTLRARVAKSREHLVSATFSAAGLQDSNNRSRRSSRLSVPHVCVQVCQACMQPAALNRCP